MRLFYHPLAINSIVKPIVANQRFARDSESHLAVLERLTFDERRLVGVLEEVGRTGGRLDGAPREQSGRFQRRFEPPVDGVRGGIALQ